MMPSCLGFRLSVNVFKVVFALAFHVTCTLVINSLLSVVLDLGIHFP